MQKETLEKHKHLEKLKRALDIKGYLFKKSKSLLSKYRKRYFIVMGDRLAYFTDDSLEDFRKEFNFKQMIDFKRIGDIVFSFTYRYTDKIHKEYLFKTDSEKIRNIWVECLHLIQQDVLSSKPLTKNLENERPRVIVKKYSEEMVMEPDIRFVFKKMKLPLLQHKYKEDYIKCRIARHFNGKEVLFMVSCKSLDKQIFDESILGKQHMGQFDFNVLYKYDTETKYYYDVIAAEKIKEISLEGEMLKINNILLTVSLDDDSLYSFIEKLKRSVSIGTEYRNSQGIPLKQNVDYLVELFDEPESRLKSQHLQLKLQDEFINIQSQNKNYKQSYQQFQVFASQLVHKAQDLLNALKLKNRDLLELSFIILRFYQQKIYKLLRTFWSQNSETMTVSDLVSMTIVSNNFFNLISQYAVDKNKTVIGIKFLRDTYLKKIIAESEIEIKNLMKNDKLFVMLGNGCSDLPMQFIRVLKNKMEVLNNTNCHDQVIEESKQLLIEAVMIVLTNQLETRIVLNNYDQNLLILECNNTWLYQELIETIFAAFDLIEVNNSILKFRKMLIKKLLSKCYSEKQTKNEQLIFVNQYFLDINVQNYYRIVTKFISQLTNMTSNTSNEISDKLSDDFNTYYLKSLVRASQKETIFINVLGQIVEKIQSDEAKVQSIFPQINLPKINSFFKCIKPIFDDKDTKQKVKERFIQLKFSIFPDDFRKSDYKSLLSLKGTFSDLDALISQLDAVVYDGDFDQKTTQSDNDSFVSFSSFTSLSGIRPRKQTSHKTEAEILLNDDIDLEGYLKKRSVCTSELGSTTNQQFVEEYFKLNSQFLLWYKNSNSHALVDRILLKEIKRVAVSETNSEEFFILLNNGMKYEFKTGTSCFASKWVEKISNTNSNQPLSPLLKAESFKNLFNQQNSKILFESEEKQADHRASLLSNHRDYQHSRLIEYDSSESPIKKKPTKTKKKFTFGGLFGCVSLQ